jgi:transcription elongation factor GreA
MPEVYLTKEGLEKFKKELDDLKTNRRPAIVARIQQAKEYGDLSENAEYEDAKNEQSFVEGRISELEALIANAQIIQNGDSPDQVGLGCKVEVQVDGEKEKYTIVGTGESEPGEGKISYSSPLGQALMGRKVREKVEVSAPDGKIEYKILKISL